MSFRRMGSDEDSKYLPKRALRYPRRETKREDACSPGQRDGIGEQGFGERGDQLRISGDESICVQQNQQTKRCSQQSRQNRRQGRRNSRPSRSKDAPVESSPPCGRFTQRCEALQAHALGESGRRLPCRLFPQFLVNFSIHRLRLPATRALEQMGPNPGRQSPKLRVNFKMCKIFLNVLASHA